MCAHKMWFPLAAGPICIDFPQNKALFANIHVKHAIKVNIQANQVNCV